MSPRHFTNSRVLLRPAGQPVCDFDFPLADAAPILNGYDFGAAKLVGPGVIQQSDESHLL
jgi:hypothetical protein